MTAKKIKPAEAWGVVWPDGALYSRTFVGLRSARQFAKDFSESPERPLDVIRVRITPVTKRKVKR